MILTCTNCQSTFQRSYGISYNSKSSDVFCSRSCAGQFHNKDRKGKNGGRCKACNEQIRKCRAYCNKCYNHKFVIANKTLGDATKGRRGANRYVAVRQHARAVYMASDKPKCCLVCGYNKHIHVGHVKGIADFPMTALVSEINSLDNLEALCPNHHWEIDHGMLELAWGKFRPVMKTKKIVEKNCECCKKIFHAPQSRRKFCSVPCAIKGRAKYRNANSKKPPKNILANELIKLNNLEAIGRKYGVTGNAVKKWAKSYGLMGHSGNAPDAADL